jgi:glycosyltransferase involved in cell wall biosynthesis
MEILLTIAIPTIEQRKECFNELYNELKKQSEPYGEQIEILSIKDNGELTIGEKRNNLNGLAKGKYVVQWDDDDWISEDGIFKIMEGIKSDCDVVSFDNYCDIQQWGRLRYFHKYCSLKYAPPVGKIDYDNSIITCTPDQKSAIKRDIIKKVKFYEMNHSEDWFYMRDILPHLKTEHYINEFIYLYLNRGGETMNLNERYKINKSSKLI